MTEIGYPVEIPWKHLSTSSDMMDTDFLDRDFPLKWKSSMAIFYYEPDLDPAVLAGRKIVYLKAVCSITGYQVDDNELGVDVRKPKEWDSRVYANFHELLRDYYPCYGAVLNFAVFPIKEKDIKRYPCIIDFEPKKREMFTVVTETGEVMSRSLHDLKVNTGGTTTTSMETIDVDKGWSFKGEGSAGGKEGASGALTLGSNYESGYKAAAQGQNVNLRQIDASQEARETVSHKTELEQMYQLLDSYHLGTNRALFAIFPRPFTGDQELSVTNGPRRLEGIQEFFFVVAMPEDSEGLCVAAQLETSHLHKQTHTETTGTTEYETGEIQQTVKDAYKGGLFSNYSRRSYQIPVPGGYIVDRSQGNGGYTENVRTREDIESHSIMVYDDRIVVEVVYDPGPCPDTAYFTADYIIYYKSPDPTSEPVTSEVTEIDLFMTGRHLSACLDFGKRTVQSYVPKWPLSEFVVYEEVLPKKFNEIYKEIPKLPRDPRRLMNKLQSCIRDRSLASINDMDRYPSGQHTILDTDFALRTISSAPGGGRFRTSDYATKVKVSALALKKLDRMTGASLAQLTRADLLRSNSAQTARQVGLTPKEIMALKKENLGIKPK